jgi:hypothetical protein
MVAAAMPGLLLGSGIAFVPTYSGTCAADQAPALAPAGHGSFFGPPTVSISTGCGRTDIHTQPGSTWQLLAGSTGAAEVVLDSDGRSLGITDNLTGSEILTGGRTAWDVTLPRMPLDQLDLNLNAQAANVDLAGTQIAELSVVANASSGRVDASAAVIGQLTAQLNLSSLSIRLPAGHDVFATVRVNGGHLALCVPNDVAMRVTSRGTAERVTVSGGLIDGTWETDSYSSATYRAEIDIQARFGAVEINPLGGCS